MFIADDKTPCQRALCECDKKASMCFRDNGAVYNTTHKGVFAKVMSKLTKKFYKWKVESILRILLFLWVFVDWYKIALSLRQCSDGFYSNHPVLSIYCRFEPLSTGPLMNINEIKIEIWNSLWRPMYIWKPLHFCVKYKHEYKIDRIKSCKKRRYGTKLKWKGPYRYLKTLRIYSYFSSWFHIKCHSEIASTLISNKECPPPNTCNVYISDFTPIFYKHLPGQLNY